MHVGLICFTSQTLAEEIRKFGHQVTTVDIKAAPKSLDHIQSPAEVVLSSHRFDFIIACPPCTYLTRAQIMLLKKNVPRLRHCVDAMKFAKMIWETECDHMVIENPPGLMARALGPRSDIVYPYDFGDPHHKELCLWLRNVPPLIRTYSSPIRKSIANKTNGRMSQEQKSSIKSSWNHYPLMCRAIAEQWFSRPIK